MTGYERLEKYKPRLVRIYNLQKEGFSFKEIAHLVGRSEGVCRYNFREAERFISSGPQWYDGLSFRTTSTLNNHSVHGRHAARKWFLDKTQNHLKANRNYGVACHQELASWLGLPDPFAKPKTICPHCGKNL